MRKRAKRIYEILLSMEKKRNRKHKSSSCPMRSALLPPNILIRYITKQTVEAGHHRIRP